MLYSHVRSFICFLKKKTSLWMTRMSEKCCEGKIFFPCKDYATTIPSYHARIFSFRPLNHPSFGMLEPLKKNRGWREMKIEYIILAIFSAIIRTVYVVFAIAFMVFEESCWKGRIGSHLRFLRPSLTILRLSIPPKNFVAWCIWNNKHWQIQIQLSLWWWPAASDCRSKNIRKFFR